MIDILFIALCAVICGANDLKAVAMYAVRKKRWLTTVLGISSVPSYTTFWTVFVILSPTALEQCFVQWVRSKLRSLKDLPECKQISIDGKAQKGTAKKGHAHSFVNIVSAWATTEGITLGQLKVDGKSNEITAVPKLLDMIDVEGAIVTLDAMGCQTSIAEKIADKRGEYALALKGNQGKLADEVENYFTQAERLEFEGVIFDGLGSKEEAHGRIEKREIYVTEDIDWLPQRDSWKNLRTIIMVKSERQLKGAAASIERRYYISSLPMDAQKIARVIRRHWSIENEAHWVLDVAFREDEQNANAGNIVENMSMIRRLSLNLLKQETTAKCGIEIRRQMAGWDEEYLLQVLGCKFFS